MIAHADRRAEVRHVMPQVLGLQRFGAQRIRRAEGDHVRPARSQQAAGADRRAWPHPALFVQMFADLRKFQQLFIGESKYEGYTDSQGNVFDGGMGGFDIDMGGGK